jgi:hypothetical protein
MSTTINTLIESHIVTLADLIDCIADRLDRAENDLYTLRRVAAGYALSWESHVESFKFLMELLDFYQDDIKSSLKNYCFEIELEYEDQYNRIKSILK